MAFIRLRDLSVEFPIYQGSHRSLKKLLLPASLQGNLARDRMDRINVRALSDISIDFRDGDRVALIGYNGAGKTTLLKVLAGIYIPTRGQIYAQGKVSSLFAVNVGVNPEATGRENIILRGMYMDATMRELGVGDLAVPRKMRRIGEAFYSRQAAYRAALTAGDSAQLLAVLQRHVFADPSKVRAPERLATYIQHSVRRLAEQENEAFGRAEVSFSDPDTPPGLKAA